MFYSETVLSIDIALTYNHFYSLYKHLWPKMFVDVPIYNSQYIWTDQTNWM